MSRYQKGKTDLDFAEARDCIPANINKKNYQSQDVTASCLVNRMCNHIITVWIEDSVSSMQHSVIQGSMMQNLRLNHISSHPTEDIQQKSIHHMPKCEKNAKKSDITITVLLRKVLFLNLFNKQQNFCR